jgi:hypothetical protein
MDFFQKSIPIFNASKSVLVMQALLLYSARVEKTFPRILFLMPFSTLLLRCKALLFKAGYLRKRALYLTKITYILFRHQLDA